jgi:NAD dependent epimerase/dehydratase
VIMKIFVTGAGGFIGSHLVERCVAEGYAVKAFIHYNSRGYCGWLENSSVLSEIEIVTGDLRDFDSVSKAMKGCKVVFHLGALIGIPYSYISPLAYIRTNIEGTYNILEAARMFDLTDVLITSTSETYGTAQYVPIDENHPAVAQSPYAATKIAADQLALSYHRSFGLPVKLVRPFNTYGPRQSARAIIPTIISQLLYGQQRLKLGNIEPTRDLVFVKDTVDGFLHIHKSDNLLGEITNISMDTEISIGALVNLIAELMEMKIDMIIDEDRVRPTNSEVNRLRGSNLKLRQNTNWIPNYTLKSGLLETISWIQEHFTSFKPEIYNV